MQLKEKSNGTVNYRPPQTCLNFFWTLSEGTDESRVEAAIQLVKMIQSVEKTQEREQITTYCVNRLIRGLGSGRKFARVGFSTALTLLLRLQKEVKTKQVVTCIRDKLTSESHAFSKAEKAGLYLGRAFAISAIVQSGRASQLDEEMMSSLVEELMLLSGKRSFLKPVCSKAIEGLINDISEKKFVDGIWTKIRRRLVKGWDGCTLDRLSLLLVCREKFPSIVNKSFVKKHWGTSLFSAENDEKLLQAIQNSTEKSCALREKVLPHLLSSGRDVVSIWEGLGEKMLSSGKDKVMSHQQFLALEMLGKMIELTSDPQQIYELILIPSATKAIFMENHTLNDALGKTLDTLVCNLCEKLKSSGGDILSFVRKIIELEGQDEEDVGMLSFIHSHNFDKIVSLLDKNDMEKYVCMLTDFIKGRDDNIFLSESARKRKKQLDWCFRQLQHISCSQSHTTQDMQRSVLALFLRNGFFNADKKNEKILHCDFVDKYVETDNVKKLCESFLFKSLDQLSTMKAEQITKSESFSRYTELLSYLVHYFQSLLACAELRMLSPWDEETHELWNQLLKRIKSTEKNKSESSSAFQLLYLYMALYLLTDVNTAKELLKDIFVCQDKSMVKEKKSKKTDENDPHWVEVLTEILLQLLSSQSHLSRVISSMVFKLMVPDLTTGATTLITQVLIPDNSQQNMMFEDKDEEEGEEDEDNGDLLDEDIPSEESDDDDDDVDDEEDEDAADKGKEEKYDSGEDEDEKMDVDEQFRASVKDVLGDAAVEDNSDEDDLPDLSDSEMFKFDEALAEVFRQRKRKAGGKKIREQKRKELANFRLRVLDLVDVLIKSNRCADFSLDLLKPLLVLMVSFTRVEEQAASNRAKSSFQLLKTKIKGMTDTSHTEEEQQNLFEELMDLAKRVTDPIQLQQIATACLLMIKVTKVDCLQILQDTLENVISKKQSKPLPSFFISLLDTDPVVFQPLTSMLIKFLKDESTKTQCKAMTCSLLTSIVKKGGQVSESSQDNKKSWMKKATITVCERVQDLDKDNCKGLYVKELLTLTLAILTRKDDIVAKNFDPAMKQRLQTIKSKMGTDSKRLINKIVAAIDRLTKAIEKQSGKKRKAEDTESPQQQKKKTKRQIGDAAV